MNKVDLYKDFMSPESHQELRKELFKIWHADPCSLMEIARRIGINYPTVRRFMVEERPMRPTSIHKIASFIKEHAKGD